MKSMLKNFIYLDTDMLEQLVDQVDGGSLEEQSTEDSVTSSKSGSGNAKLISGAVGQEKSSRTTRKLKTSPAMQFNRLHDYCESNPVETGWEYIKEPSQFNLLAKGKLVESKVDISIPEDIRALTKIDKISQFLELLDSNPALKASMPDWNEEERRKLTKQANTIRSFQEAYKGKLVIRADFANEVNAKYVGKLNTDFLVQEDELEDDDYTIIGKVRMKWGKGEWIPPLSLSRMDLFNRESRRKMMRTEPDEGDTTSIEGPAALLQVLAIYC